MIRRAAILATLLALAACEQDFDPPYAIACPPLDDPNTTAADFALVSSLLEKRCGTLDCHGSLYRPLRIYGKDGLRSFTEEEYNDPALAQTSQTFSGGSPTTEGELDLTRRSICGLEPGKMAGAMDGTIDPSTLLLLQKPRGDLTCDGRDDDGCARHKGGQVLVNSAGATDNQCIISWIHPTEDVPFDEGACNDALQVD
jgi:hypothetical protein